MHKKEARNKFLEDSYIDKLKDNYSIVEKTNLPPGIYKKHGGGYQFYIHDHFDEDTGFVVITNDGIKGIYSGKDVVVIENGLPVGEDVYKIMVRKDLLREEKLNELLKDSN
jgi:hypothetical protein